jgi:hypothetical protein
MMEDERFAPTVLASDFAEIGGKGERAEPRFLGQRDPAGQ